MIKSITFKNWKSFRDATLYIDPLTVLIGTNASGKSNALEALDFLSQLAQGERITTTAGAVRGSLRAIARDEGSQFSLEAVIEGEDEKVEYEYRIVIEIKTTQAQLLGETLTRKTRELYEEDEHIFWTDEARADQKFVQVHLTRKNSQSQDKIAANRSVSVLSQLVKIPHAEEDIALQEVTLVLNQLQNLFVLNPVPAKMRFYSPLSDSLKGDASNIAGFLANLPAQLKQQIETKMAHYATRLPEGDFCRVWAESVAPLNKDAMLYVQEKWAENQECRTVDASTISDGTLHFLAVLTALLTRPEGSLLAIEEVDSGLHPSRAELLMQAIKEIGTERKLDVLVTTHDTALLNALGPGMTPFVTIAHRDPETGESRLTTLDEIEDLPRFIAYGPLGEVAAAGLIEKSLITVETE